jgi:L-aspartate oxidase
LYYADHTGKLITEHITRAAHKHPLVTFQEGVIVTDLLVEQDVCVGVETLGGIELASRGVVLASGGLAGIYQHSTNPSGFNALGSSVALAVRSGVRTQDLEFVQFHPTSLYMPNESRFLLTEALRGEGAILRNAQGRAFAKDFHADGELAPRDVVARGVFHEAQQTDGQIYLDITHRDQDWLYGRFPSIQKHLKDRGLDLARDLLPITPAAHYTCGGVTTDMNGRTSLPGLYAAGEAARTGLHGGNRLASTSLLEGLVFGAAVADFVGKGEGQMIGEQARMLLAKKDLTRAIKTEFKEESSTAVSLLGQLKKCMWDNVGVVRTPASLAEARDIIRDIKNEASDLFADRPSRQTTALRDAAFAGEAVAQAAAANKVSVGAHCIVTEEEDSDDDDQLAAASR